MGGCTPYTDRFFHPLGIKLVFVSAWLILGKAGHASGPAGLTGFNWWFNKAATIKHHPCTRRLTATSNGGL